ncbi:MAG: flagellar hook-associated protein FlgK [Candidatus Hydrogenedentes bacterium]|nr:flagellar hook-associated protein FlgK [Candidatus Hydrogenedentota bacterium]
MGTLFSALDIGRAGLQVAQVQLDVTAHNIANVNKEGFSRQRVEVATRTPNFKPYGTLGRGPGIQGIERLRDTFFDTVYRQQVPGLGKAEVKANLFTLLEDTFQEPGEEGFASRLNLFFDAINDFANNVEAVPVRVGLLTEAESMAASLRDTANRLDLLVTNANEEVRNLVPEINSLLERIGASNVAIRDAELSGRTANDLRDDRDVLLDELARLVFITTRETDAGQVTVLIGGVESVRGDRVRLLETFIDPTINPDRPDLLGVRYVDVGEAANIVDGELAGALEFRDVDARGQIIRHNQMAAALIQAINAIHSQANGAINYTSAVSSTNAVSDSTIPLSLNDLTPFPIQTGSFDINIYDATNTLVSTLTINIDASGNVLTESTLNSIRDDIDAGANISASTSGGILTITPDAGFSIGFSNDTANILPALGINGLFTGSTAFDIEVNQDLIDEPLLLASGYSTDFLETGDNTAALDMADVRILDILEGNTQTINQFFEGTIVNVGVATRSNNDQRIIQESFVQDFDRRRQEVSGVNINEEVTNLLQFQRAFEASARIITTTDRMLETLLNIVR